jgi:RNA polymerase sigma factor (sigma-70 family)
VDKLVQHVNAVSLPVHAAQVTALFNDHNRALHAFLIGKLSSLADAQEVAQEAYMRLLTLEHPELVGSLRAYLFRIASNLATDRLRMRTTRKSVPMEEASEESLTGGHAPEQHVQALQQWRRIREALKELPKKTSRAFVLHAVEGRDFGVIAQLMNISERMVRYHVTQALAHCRARVDNLEMP